MKNYFFKAVLIPMMGLFLGQLVHIPTAAAQNLLSVRDTSADSGALNVVIPIDLTVDQDLTLLSFEVGFGATLCGIVADRNDDGVITGAVVGTSEDIALDKDIVVRRDANAVTEPAQEVIFPCAGGKMPMAVFSLAGSTVVTSGSNEIYTIELDIRADATPGRYPMTPANIQARRGPLAVSITGGAGDLIIGTACTIDADCVDDNLCTEDQCVGGFCQRPPVDCNDGLSCTDDRCDDPAVGCENIPNDGLCNDLIECTDDSCQPDLGDPTTGCLIVPNDGLCLDDGLVCTVESCDLFAGCLATAVDGLCDDGDACTQNVCDPISGCEYPPVPSACGNGCLEEGEGEECDDGNNVDGDGCSAECKIEARLDHFLCYKVKESKGTLCSTDAVLNVGGACATEEDCGGNSDLPTGFCLKNTFPKGVQVALGDQFEDGIFDARKPASLCNPANKNGSGIFDPLTHLKGYQIKLAKTDPRQPKPGKHQARVNNQLGTLFVETSKSDRLLVPTSKDLQGPAPEPQNHAVEHFKCYKVKVRKGICEADPRVACRADADCEAVTGACNLGFPKGLVVSVEDQFEQPKQFEVKKPRRLCLPAEKTLLPDGVPEPVKRPQDHLMCYQVKPAKGEPKHLNVLGIYVNNQFGPSRLDTVKEDELCVPSEKTVPRETMAGVWEEDGGADDDDEADDLE